MLFTFGLASPRRVLEQRELGCPRDEWTTDPVLLRGRFCNIDRRDDAVTRELLREWKQRPGWTTEQKVVLAAALRFTSSRRGGALQIGGLVDQQTELKPEGEPRASGASSALAAALLDGGVVACGTGTYQMTLSRAQVARRLHPMVRALLQHVEAHGPFVDVASAGEFVAERMALRRDDADARGRDMRPSFAAAETAKDLAYLDGLLAAQAASRCSLGPGARKGLTLVRQAGASLPAEEESAVHMLLAQLRNEARLGWMRAIDVVCRREAQTSTTTRLAQSAPHAFVRAPCRHRSRRFASFPNTCATWRRASPTIGRIHRTRRPRPRCASLKTPSRRCRAGAGSGV